MTIDEYRDLLGAQSLQSQYFNILSDQVPHCRKCAQQQVGSEQLAGGGGVQGLQRGNKSRPGIVITSKRQQCPICGKSTTWDCWTGEFKESNSAAGISAYLQKRILTIYNYCDSIEQRIRPESELIIDHRFPMERWDNAEAHNADDMSEEEIKQKFQLLKKDDSGNHNLLKSRACEHCIATGERGCPLGIEFFYVGTRNWPENCPTHGSGAEQGCLGCGWYDFATWRKALNKIIKKDKK